MRSLGTVPDPGNKGQQKHPSPTPTMAPKIPPIPVGADNEVAAGRGIKDNIYKSVMSLLKIHVQVIVFIRIFFYSHLSARGLCMTHLCRISLTKVVCHMIVLGCSVLREAVCVHVRACVCVCVCVTERRIIA